jgi:hypothetical protein
MARLRRHRRDGCRHDPIQHSAGHRNGLAEDYVSEDYGQEDYASDGTGTITRQLLKILVPSDA